MQSALSDVWLI